MRRRRREGHGGGYREGRASPDAKRDEGTGREVGADLRAPGCPLGTGAPFWADVPTAPGMGPGTGPGLRPYSSPAWTFVWYADLSPLAQHEEGSDYSL